MCLGWRFLFGYGYGWAFGFGFGYRFPYPLAIPLSIRSSRHGGLLFCVGINIAMGFIFSFIYAMSISLGKGGTFDPILATWGPNLLFTVLGFYLNSSVSAIFYLCLSLRPSVAFPSPDGCNILAETICWENYNCPKR